MTVAQGFCRKYGLYWMGLSSDWMIQALEKVGIIGGSKSRKSEVRGRGSEVMCIRGKGSEEEYGSGSSGQARIAQSTSLSISPRSKLFRRFSV